MPSRRFRWWQNGVKQQVLGFGIDTAWNDNNEHEIWSEAGQCTAAMAGHANPDPPLGDPARAADDAGHDRGQSESIPTSASTPSPVPARQGIQHLRPDVERRQH